MTTNEIKWIYGFEENKIWTSDCGWYRIIENWFTSTIILEDYTDENRLYTHLEKVKEGMDIANYRKEKLQ